MPAKKPRKFIKSSRGWKIDFTSPCAPGRSEFDQAMFTDFILPSPGGKRAALFYSMTEAAMG